MIKNKCKHEWEKHTNIGPNRRPSTFICKKCDSEMTAGEVFQLENLREQEDRHRELIENQNIYNSKQLFWSRILALATIALVIATLLLIKI